MIEHKTQSIEEEPTKEKTRQIYTSVSIDQDHGAPPQIIMIEKVKSRRGNKKRDRGKGNGGDTKDRYSGNC